MREFWVPVKGHPRYEVSSLGRIRKIGEEKMLCWHLNDGCKRVRLDGKKYYIHRLVMDSFFDDYNGEYITHINGDKYDNSLANLSIKSGH